MRILTLVMALVVVALALARVWYQIGVDDGAFRARLECIRTLEGLRDGLREEREHEMATATLRRMRP